MTKEKPTVDVLLNLFKTHKEEINSIIKDEIKNELKKIYNEQKPTYITYLIDNGYLYPYGRRVINSLKDTAASYVTFTKQNVTSQFLEESFLKPSGEKYSKKMCSDARDYANTK